MCCKHIAVEEGTSVSYRARDERARRSSAEKRREQQLKSSANPNKSAQYYGPPDRSSNFCSSAQQKRKLSCRDNDQPHKKKAISIGKSVVQYIPNSQPDVMGKQVETKFKISGKKWFQGVITTYNGLTGHYGIHFPYDSQTIDVTLDDEDLRFL